MVTRKSVKELREICQPNTGRSWSEKITRKYSIYMTWIFIRTSLRPNHITLLSCLLAFAAMWLISLFNEFSIWVIAILILLFSYSLDYVDGEVARYHKTSSLTGLLLDRLASTITATFLFLGVMYRTYLITGSVFSILFGILSILSVYVPRLAMSSMYQSALEAILRTSNVTGTVISASESTFTTLDQISGKESIPKQIAWFLLGQGRIWFLFGVFVLEFLLQNGMLLQLLPFLSIIPLFQGIFLTGFLFYYGVCWLSAGLIFSLNIIRSNQVESLYGHLQSILKEKNEDTEGSS